MKGTFAYDIQTHYPHMKPRDVHLWEKFIRANAGFFDSCNYDTPVGEPPKWLDIKNDEMAMKQKILYQKKIDVVGFKGDDVYIVEVKPNAGSTALGQLLTYRNLWIEKHSDVQNVKLMLITNKLQNEYNKPYSEHNILVNEVGYCRKCLNI